VSREAPSAVVRVAVVVGIVALLAGIVGFVVQGLAR
jgi:hypothetical protein